MHARTHACPQHRPSDTWSSAYLSAVLPKLRGYGIPELQVSAPACSALYDLQVRASARCAAAAAVCTDGRGGRLPSLPPVVRGAAAFPAASQSCARVAEVAAGLGMP